MPAWEHMLEGLLAGIEEGVTHELELVERIANAVLYEGYILYPYRAFVGEEPPAFHLRCAVSAGL